MPEEGVDLGPQRIRVFISGNSGNKEVSLKWHDNMLLFPDSCGGFSSILRSFE